MDIVIVLLLSALGVWAFVAWVTYLTSGWRKFQIRFHWDKATYVRDVATSVSLKKFGNYNSLICVGFDDYGVIFRPRKFLFFHRGFAIPWIQILSFEYAARKKNRTCILHTQIGDVRIVGDVAEVVAHGCTSHFVAFSEN